MSPRPPADHREGSFAVFVQPDSLAGPIGPTRPLAGVPRGMVSGAVSGESARDLLVLKSLQRAPGFRDYAKRMNMVHISAWGSALGLLEGSARILERGAPLIMYGPWLADDLPTAPSNLAFDSDLKRRNPQWGLRRVEDFADAAEKRGLVLEQTRAMPANNQMLLLRRT